MHMLLFPKDILTLYPHVRIINADSHGIIIPTNDTYKGGDVLQTLHCLELVLSGFNTVYSGSAVQTIKEGVIQFRKRGNYQFHPSKDYSAILFFIEDQFIFDFLKQHAITFSNDVFESDISPFVFKSTNFIQAQIEEARQVIAKPERYSSCILKLSVHNILLHILAKEETKRFVTYLKYLVSDRKVELQYFMEKNFTQHLTLTDLAKQTGRSLSSFKKDFADTFGTTPVKWIMNKRLEHAAYLLKNTTNSVSEIAYECGFENTSHFSRSYRAKYGLSPTSSR